MLWAPSKSGWMQTVFGVRASGSELRTETGILHPRPYVYAPDDKHLTINLLKSRVIASMEDEKAALTLAMADRLRDYQELLQFCVMKSQRAQVGILPKGLGPYLSGTGSAISSEFRRRQCFWGSGIDVTARLPEVQGGGLVPVVRGGRGCALRVHQDDLAQLGVCCLLSAAVSAFPSGPGFWLPFAIYSVFLGTEVGDFTCRSSNRTTVVPASQGLRVADTWC
ncbi:hypothetical protein CB1_000559009 [Camelus ferus]|nr:hypothetical protein CB1_000559009 [Camelus ferus]